MAIIVTPTVIRTLISYYRSLLRQYPITPMRAYEKYKDFWDYVHAYIANDFSKSRICRYMDMGQKFAGKKLLIPNLRMIDYQDKAETHWYVAFLYNSETNDIVVTRIKMASHVTKESKEQRSIILTESQLSNIIRESIIETLYS